MLIWTRMGMICCILFAGAALPGEEAGFEAPFVALRLLAGSLVEECSICAESDTKKAFALIDKRFPPASELRSTPDCAFIKTAECGPAEFVSACYASRMPYEGPGGKKGALPLLVFRFHTVDGHLVGIAPGDYTAEAVALKMKALGPGRAFDASIEIIAFRYGDGAAFSYSPGENRLTVHCRVLAVEKRR
ncbi:MAG TPA: hypothetical protein PKO25_09615 [Spirochaetota bacterium]|nr:hypothetical protein [Spirochaetota bacterium]HPV97694.1 hypothetical protein [Spirochaetota bacterium]